MEGHLVVVEFRRTDRAWPIVMSRRLALTILLVACARQELPSQQPVCRPVDGAWAVSVRVTDAVTGRPITNAIASTMMSVAETDSLGWICLRSFAQEAETLEFRRSGYREVSLTVSGVIDQVVARDLRLERVPRPCCDLHGQWSITLQLESPGARQPKPKVRSVTGAVSLGPRYLPSEPDDDLDSLVHIVRGLHQVDFTPFFGGPVAHDVSTSVFGNGPDLLHEVEGSVPAGDSVAITFIPRMTHGSLSLYGRIRADTIRGHWWQNMYCCGAEGSFVMTRTGPADTTPPASAPMSGYHRTLPHGLTAVAVPAGLAPNSNWRPELGVAPDGRLWLASGGLFVADSFGGPWRRVLGGDADPVEGDELLIGIAIAFAGAKTVIIGLPERYPMEGAPVLYRTDDDGATWSAIRLDRLYHVHAIGAIGRSVWVMGSTRERDTEGFFVSADGGRTWRAMTVPETMQDVNLLHRVSASTAYVATSGREGRPALWRTTDGGGHWLPLQTPSEQHLLRLGESDSRVEQIATIGTALVVREHGRVFASAVNPLRWRPLVGVEAIASELSGTHVFVLIDSLRPALLDKDLLVEWRSDRRLPLEAGSYIEGPAFQGDIGYVTEGPGSIHQIRNRTLRVLRPVPDIKSRQNVEILITPKP